jgi:ribosome biogenesis GTPase
LDDIADLQALGYSPRWQALFEPFSGEGLVPARVVRSDRGSALLATPAGIVRGQPSAGLSKAARGSAAMPATGDWVAARADDGLDVALIEAVLERASAITRGDPGNVADIQVLAANIDTVFVVHPIAEPPNLRRIERELSLAWDSGAVPVVVLTKADLSADAEAARQATESVAPGVDVLVTNALAGESAANPRSSTGSSANSGRPHGTCASATGAGATRRSPASSSRCRAVACSSTRPDCGRWA